MRTIRASIGFLVLALAGCGPGNSPDNPIKVGQDDFVTLERDYSASRDMYGGMAPSSEANAGAGGAGGGAQDAKAPSGREGTVEEADIYRVDGSRLFYLNTYRGFIIYDLADPKNPKRVSRLPVHGYPIEMFVTQNTVYALLRDALYLTQDATGLKFSKHNVSQLVAIDITDLANPKVLTTIDIVGQLKEGVSRKIDDTIYVVSHMPQSYYYRGYPYAQQRTEQAWVYSFNVADPKNMVLVEKLKIFEGGGYNASTSNSYSSRWFSGVAISATSNTLHVVENWYTYGSVYGGRYNCGTWQSMQEAVVSVIDISDPTGKIRLHSRFSTYGALTDQFKHTYVYDQTTQKGYYLGIFARQEWGSVNCSGGMFIQNNFEAWDVTDGANPKRVSTLAFGKPNETVRGSTFDMDKKIAYAITAMRRDPLYAMSFADPNNLRVLSAIDGLSGDMNLFRLVGGGKFLLAIGQDNDDACTGFGTPSTGWSANVSVSVIDVQDSSAIRLVQRKCVTVNNASWVWSEINWNLDQAHKMIGLSQDARASVVSVPVNYYTRMDPADGWWWYRPESAVGLMSFDLAAYDPAKDHLNQTVLKNHGTIVHDAGHVRRSIVFVHPVTQRRVMVNLSDTHVALTDIDDLDVPVKQSVIEVAPRHQRLFRFGDYLVDEIGAGDDYGSYYGQGASEFRVKRAETGADEATPVAVFSAGRVQQVLQHGTNLVVFRQIPANDAKIVPWYLQNETEALIFDLKNPASPVLASAIRLPTTSMPYVRFGCADWGWWPGWYYGGSWAKTAKGIGMLVWEYAQYTSTQKLLFLDLSDPALPVLSQRTLASQTYDTQTGQTRAGRQYVGLVGDEHGLLATFKEKVGSFGTLDGAWFARMKYYAERFDDGTLAPQTPVNVLGRVIRSWDASGQEFFLTTDERFSYVKQNTWGSWVPESRLHLLARSAPTRATLKDTLALDGRQLGDLVGDSEKLFLTLQPNYYSGYYGVAEAADGTTTTDTHSDTLNIIDLRAGTLNRTFSGQVGTYSAQLMGTVGDRLFVNLPGDGVLAVDVSDLGAPFGQHFLRTLGYASHMVFGNDIAFIAAGNFGIYEMNLGAPSTIKRL